MPETIMQGTKEQGFIGDTPVDPALLETIKNGVAPLGYGLPDNRAAVLLELAGIKVAIRTWQDKQPDQILYEASGYSARLTELWTMLREVEEHDRTWKQLRTMQVQPVIDEVDRQFEFAKSRIAMSRQDLDLMARGS